MRDITNKLKKPGDPLLETLKSLHGCIGNTLESIESIGFREEFVDQLQFMCKELMGYSVVAGDKIKTPKLNDCRADS